MNDLQPGVDAGELWLQGGATPLLAIAHERLDDLVVVHIAGGIRVDGRLASVNEDETITVIDKSRRYDIALASVAVIEGAKS